MSSSGLLPHMSLVEGRDPQGLQLMTIIPVLPKPGISHLLRAGPRKPPSVHSLSLRLRGWPGRPGHG